MLASHRPPCQVQKPFSRREIFNVDSHSQRCLAVTRSGWQAQGSQCENLIGLCKLVLHEDLKRHL